MENERNKENNMKTSASCQVPWVQAEFQQFPIILNQN